MLTLPLLALVLAAPTAKADPKDLATQIVGEWTMEKFVFDGEPIGMDSPDEKPGVFVFEADGKLTIKMPDGKKIRVDVGTYKLDAKKSPVELVATPGKGSKEPKFSGIVKISGDTLSICLGQNGEAQPKNFDSKKGSLRTLMEFKRAKKGK